jgi:predicted PurR-regulated permease PerM
MRTVRIEIAPRIILYVVLAVGALWLLHAVWSVVMVVLIALIIAGTVKPGVEMLERHGLRRGGALAVVYASAFVVVIGLLVVAVPPLVSQLLDMLGNAPREKTALVTWLSHMRGGAQVGKAIDGLPLDQLISSAEGRLLSASPEAMTAIGYGVTTMFLSIYLIADAKRIDDAMYGAVPAKYHARLARIVANLETIVGGYMRGQLITSAAITVFNFVLLSALGVRDALSLAVFSGITDVIPFIGGLLATVPAVLASLGKGTTTAIVVAAIMLLYQLFESRILVPRLYGKVLSMSPALVIVALLVGGTLMGILGAFLALPVAAGLQMVGRELRADRVESAARKPDGLEV